MSTYLIHCSTKRLWYVKELLIPSMLKQGIQQKDILIYQDKNRIGNLRAWVDSCNRISLHCKNHDIDGVWHLQDDVVISKNFKQMTEQYDTGLVCGFTCAYDREPEPGYFHLYQEKMWFSFPCIRIPSDILSEFTDWANINLWQSEYFNLCVRKNNSDDLVFREWLYDNHADMEHLNLAPNPVNHVDKLIGGSLANPQRDKEQDTMSIFWDEQDVIDNLISQLKKVKKI